MASWTQLRRYLRLAMVIVVMVTIAGCMRTEVAPPVEQPGQGQPPSESEEGPLGTLVQMSDGPGSARAWVELMPKIVLGEDPLGVYEVRFHAQADATVEIVIPEVILEVGHDSLVTWLSDGRVLFANAFLADTSTGEYSRLNVAMPGALAPSHQRIAFWGGKVVSILEIETGQTRQVASFGPDDWDTGEPTIGIPPKAGWLDDQTLLFDMPSNKAPSIGMFRLDSGEITQFRAHAWGVQCSGDGRYVAYIEREGWGHSPSDKSRLAIQNVITGQTSYVDVSGDVFSARVLWPDEDVMAVANRTSVELYRFRDGVWSPARSIQTSGQVIDMRQAEQGVEYSILVREGGVPLGCTIQKLLLGSN